MALKTCSQCFQPKELTAFNVRRASRDGLTSKCRDCAKAWAKNYRKAQPDRVRASERRSYEKHKETHAIRAKSWAEKNKEKVKEIKRSYYERNREVCLARAKAQYLADPEGQKIAALERARRNPESRRRAKKAWKFRNLDRVVQDRACRRAMELRAMPSWVDRREIQLIYSQAKNLAELTGEIYEVDHIVPLRGRGVCGLHVPWNLRAIPAKENRTKGNKLIPELVG